MFFTAVITDQDNAPAIRRIKGIELTKWTTAEFHADLAARVAAA